MKIIYKGHSVILNLIATSKVRDNDSYKKSIFNLYIPVEDGVLIYNTLTRSIGLCDEKEYHTLMKNECDDEFITTLIKYGFIRSVEIDEMKVCDQICMVLKGYENSNYINSYTIFTTTKCNARCKYCYEIGCKQFDMTLSTAKQLVNFIISNNANNKDKTIKLSWFGGEPLYNYKVIDYICKSVSENGFKVKSTMVSNGFLFSDELIETAKSLWNLTRVQITLDGTEEKYNKIKNYKDNKDDNPFVKVCNNIEKLLKNNIRVAIRLNATKDNIDDLYKLVDFIYQRFMNYKNFYVYTGIVSDYSFIDKAWNSVERNNIITERNKLEDYIYSLGLKNYIRTSKLFKTTQCMADNKSSVVVYPNGDLGKCEHFEKDDIIGNIFDGYLNSQKIKGWELRYNNKDMCQNCSYYPLCIRLVKCPAFKGLNCNKFESSYYLTNLKHSVVSEYREWQAKNEKQT